MIFKNYFILFTLTISAIITYKKSIAHDLRSSVKIDTDVYVVGSISAANGNSVAVYWKNGVVKQLSDSTVNCYGQGIAVNGNNVYVCGYYKIDGINTAVYWKNGIGNDVYAAGYTTNADDGHYVPTYWKNGVAVSFTDDKFSSELHGIALVDDNVVYAAGWTNADGAVYWKNGVKIPLAGDDATGIVVVTHQQH